MFLLLSVNPSAGEGGWGSEVSLGTILEVLVEGQPSRAAFLAYFGPFLCVTCSCTCMWKALVSALLSLCPNPWGHRNWAFGCPWQAFCALGQASGPSAVSRLSLELGTGISCSTDTAVPVLEGCETPYLPSLVLVRYTQELGG